MVQGHQSDLFCPTHSLELVEAAALRSAVEKELIEGRNPSHGLRYPHPIPHDPGSVGWVLSSGDLRGGKEDLCLSVPTEEE